jgi:excinuclease ABC subunit A
LKPLLADHVIPVVIGGDFWESGLDSGFTGFVSPLIPAHSTTLKWVHHLMDVIQRLVDKGNSVLVIEHNLDVIRCSDWIIDLGPEGGDKGGQIVVSGTPEEVAEHPTSHTGRYLKQVLEQHPPMVAAA